VRGRGKRGPIQHPPAAATAHAGMLLRGQAALPGLGEADGSGEALV